MQPDYHPRLRVVLPQVLEARSVEGQLFCNLLFSEDQGLVFRLPVSRLLH